MFFCTRFFNICIKCNSIIKCFKNTQDLNKVVVFFYGYLLNYLLLLKNTIAFSILLLDFLGGSDSKASAYNHVS